MLSLKFNNSTIDNYLIFWGIVVFSTLGLIRIFDCNLYLKLCSHGSAMEFVGLAGLFFSSIIMFSEAFRSKNRQRRSTLGIGLFFLWLWWEELADNFTVFFHSTGFFGRYTRGMEYKFYGIYPTVNPDDPIGSALTFIIFPLAMIISLGGIFLMLAAFLTPELKNPLNWSVKNNFGFKELYRQFKLNDRNSRIKKIIIISALTIFWIIQPLTAGVPGEGPFSSARHESLEEFIQVAILFGVVCRYRYGTLLFKVIPYLMLVWMFSLILVFSNIDAPDAYKMWPNAIHDWARHKYHNYISEHKQP